MNWTDLTTSSVKARSPREAPAASVKFLPMNLTADEALAEWDAHWLRCTDPEHTGGEALHLSAHRERFERLARQEETGVIAMPVELPARPMTERPTHFAHEAAKPREGHHKNAESRAHQTRVWLRNKREKGELV